MKYFILFLLALGTQTNYAQHDHTTPSTTKRWEHIKIFGQPFSDSSFNGKEVQVVHFTVPAGGRDTIVHVHDCHLIGYILEGQVITKLKNKPEQLLKKGEVFYEFPNEVHESLRNPDKEHDAKILLYYLYNKNAVLYRRL